MFLVLFVAIELTTDKPVVSLRLLSRRNFGLGTAAVTLLGFALYGSVYVIPQFLGQVYGYNSEQIGSVMAWIGLPQLIIIPIVPKITARYDARAIVAVGFGLFALSCFINLHMSPDYAGDQMLLPNLVRACGQALILAPLTGIAMVDVARDKSAAASGIFNMMRNLGGAFGTALLATLITKREQYHSNVIGSAVTLFRDSVRDRISQLSGYFAAHGVTDPAEAQHQAVVAIGNAVRKQALIMGFADTFRPDTLCSRCGLMTARPDRVARVARPSGELTCLRR